MCKVLVLGRASIDHSYSIHIQHCAQARGSGYYTLNKSNNTFGMFSVFDSDGCLFIRGRQTEFDQIFIKLFYHHDRDIGCDPL